MNEREILLSFQKNEITEFHIYGNLARICKDKNRKTLEKLSSDERRHYFLWKKHTRTEVNANKAKIFFYTLMSRIFGLTFAIKLMENGEKGAEKNYARVVKKYPYAKGILRDENLHEKKLVAMIDEEKVNHIGSMVLGINDALVEITGTLAGLTFALQNSSLVGIAGVITGISATLSMAASEYLSKRSEGGKNSLKAAVYTGIAYLLAVTLLVGPYFIFRSPFVSLGVALIDAVLTIALFTWFTSVVKDVGFKKSFTEMFSISMSVAVVSFLIGLVARNILRIDV
jgi:VIT1/CCC1 family predicted Fe2+/Mn2+ transporter